VKLRDFSLLDSKQDKGRLLAGIRGFNDDQRDYPRDKTIPVLFSATPREEKDLESI
jgi:hypothetical protein